MAGNLKAIVVRVQQASRIDLTGQVHYFKRVTYTVGNHGPFQAEIPDAEFTAAKVREIMSKTAAELNILEG